MIELTTMPMDTTGLGSRITENSASEQTSVGGNATESDFKGMVDKLMDKSAKDQPTNETQAGQQVSDEQVKKESTADDTSAAIAQAELLLGSVGVMQGMPEVASSAYPATDVGPALQITSQGSQTPPTDTVDVTPNIASAVEMTAQSPAGEVAKTTASPVTVSTSDSVADMMAQTKVQDLPVESTQTVPSTEIVDTPTLPQNSLITNQQETVTGGAVQGAVTAEVDGLSAKTLGEDQTVTKPVVGTDVQQAEKPVDDQSLVPQVQVMSEAMSETKDSPKQDQESVGGSEDKRMPMTGKGNSTVPMGSPIAGAEVTVAKPAPFVVSTDSKPLETLQSEQIDKVDAKKPTGPDNTKNEVPFVPVSNRQPESNPVTEPKSVTAPMAPEPVVSAKVINHVVSAAKLHSFENGTGMAIRLDPPHLGTVQMNVAVSNGAVTASIETSTESARQILQSDMAALKQSLSDAGIRVDSISVSVNTNNQGWHPPTGGQNGQNAYGKQPNYAAARHSLGYGGIGSGSESVRTAHASSSGRFDYLA